MEPANPDFGGGYVLTRPDGTQYRIDGSTGMLTQATNRNGNTIQFSESGVNGSGVEVKFERDMVGRITKVIDPVGNSIKYSYDQLGNLIKIIDRNGNSVQFTYRDLPSHYLDQIIDPLNKPFARYEYDADGRLVRTVDKVMKSWTSHSTPTIKSLKLSITGRRIVQEYDSRGNIVASTDPMGLTTRRIFDESNQVLSVTSSSGAITQFKYDSQGREIERTTSTGGKYFFTYENGALSSETDPSGRTTQYLNDHRGNVTSIIDPGGNRTIINRDERGLVTSRIDALGNQTHYGYDTAGRRTTITNALGKTSHVEYDALGNVVRESTSIDTDEGPMTMATTNTYDAEGDKFQVQTHSDRLSTRFMTLMATSLKKVMVIATRLSIRMSTIGGLNQRCLTARLSKWLIILLVNLTSLTDATGRTNQFEIDAGGRPTKQVFADATPDDLSDNRTQHTSSTMQSH